MKESNLSKFKKEYRNVVVSGFMVMWILFILFIAFFEFTRLNVFLIFIFLNILDIFLTDIFIFGMKNNIESEMNPIGRFMMKVFNKNWKYVILAISWIVFYFIFYKLEPSETTFIVMGIYIMIVFSNFTLISKDILLKKYHLKMKAVRDKPDIYY